jgi:pimeloyl-ACP methyl ester carboxylesterase
LERRTVTYHQSEFSFLTGGRGDKILVCLHGFGESADSFSFLEQYLLDEFTVYAIDFPCHGQTKFQQNDFSVTDLIAVLELMIPAINRQPVYLLGYSMGCRMALSLVEQIPAKIKKAVLLAPDGIKVNGWYRLATQTSIGNRLFKYTMQHPQWFATVVNILNKLNLVNKGLAKYVHKYIDDKKIREDLYHIWTTMRKFRPDIHRVKQQVISNHIPIKLVFGKHDRVIPYETGYRLQKGCETWISMHELQSGHLLLKEKHTAVIISLLINE